MGNGQGLVFKSAGSLVGISTIPKLSMAPFESASERVRPDSVGLSESRLLLSGTAYSGSLDPDNVFTPCRTSLRAPSPIWLRFSRRLSPSAAQITAALKAYLESWDERKDVLDGPFRKVRFMPEGVEKALDTWQSEWSHLPPLDETPPLDAAD